ncbi:MAG: putative replicase [Circoviridae sp.]|nr:MAG: putative replicase [Circoviridae sp.]
MSSSELARIDSDMRKLIDLEMKELYKRKIRQLLEQEYLMDSLGSNLSLIKKSIVANKTSLCKLNATKNNNGYLWITINPAPKVEFEKFKVKITKLVNRAMFTKCEYVYEQRGTSLKEAGKGFHCHILATRDMKYKPSKCISNIKNTCKTLVGNVNNNNQLNIQIIGDDYANDKREYMSGVKTGEGKDQKQIIDKSWRHLMEIEEKNIIITKKI